MYSSQLPRKDLIALLDSIKQLLRRLLPIPLRVIARPPPQILTSILQRTLRLPSQLLISQTRVGSEIEHVTVTAADHLVWWVLATGFTESLDHLEDGGTATSSEIVGLDTWCVLAEVVESD